MKSLRDEICPYGQVVELIWKKILREPMQNASALTFIFGIIASYFYPKAYINTLSLVEYGGNIRKLSRIDHVE